MSALDLGLMTPWTEASGDVQKRQESWQKTVKTLRACLPLQNPLQRFLHNNMLMAFEDQDFWEGLEHAADLYRGRMYKPLSFYRAHLQTGRISEEALFQAIADECEGAELWLARPYSMDNRNIQILAALMKKEGCPANESLAKLYKQSLGRTSESTSAESAPFLWEYEYSQRLEGSLQEGFFPPSVVDWLCHVMESYLDKGCASWHVLNQELSLLDFVKRWCDFTIFMPHSWQRELKKRCTEWSQGNSSFIQNLQDAHGYDDQEWALICQRLLFALKGWSGMINKMETEPEHSSNSHVRLEDWLVLLLMLGEITHGHFHDLHVPLGQGLALSMKRTIEVQPSLVAEIFLKMLGSYEQAPITKRDVISLLQELSSWGEGKTARVWHKAYENSAYITFLSTLQESRRRTLAKADGSMQREDTPCQILCCIDDREESLRRHIEALDPRIETYGVLGNFNLDMKFKGASSARLSQQCPPVVKARRVLWEESERVKDGSSVRGFRQLSHRFYKSISGTLLGSIQHFATLGPLSLVLLLLKAMIPGRWSMWQRRRELRHADRNWGKISRQRFDHPEWGECGYSIEEQALIVKSVLDGAGLQGHLAPLVIALAHEASSVNNPFAQAYGCGACSGHSGAPNARVFADMANDAEVRKALASMGCIIPDKTYFIAAVHDTTADVIRYFNSDTQTSLRQVNSFYFRVREILEAALAANAVERCRMFSNSVAQDDPEACRKHVLQRSGYLAEPRPEYGHSRVGFAVFGRRYLSRYACLDRRSFLVSHHPQENAEADVLKGLLHGAMPVVANINLDYFFSSLDPHGFGAGSKLPLNVSGLIGVISGSRSDLRLGLAAQMTELHEPIRALVCI